MTQLQLLVKKYKAKIKEQSGKNIFMLERALPVNRHPHMLIFFGIRVMMENGFTNQNRLKGCRYFFTVYIKKVMHSNLHILCYGKGRGYTDYSC